MLLFIIRQVLFEHRSDKKAPEARNNDADFLYQPSGSPIHGAAWSAHSVPFQMGSHITEMQLFADTRWNFIPSSSQLPQMEKNGGQYSK